MKMKMRRVFCFTLITVFLIVITVVAAQSPVDEVEDEENEEVARPIRASPRRRVKSRNNNNKSNSNEDRGVQKRRLPGAFRPTRAPLFEASPPDPFLDGEIGPNGHNGHSHSPPTRDPYYSPSRFEREKKRHRIRLTSEAPLRNSFDVSGSTEYSGNDQAYNAPGKNYAFAYAVGDNSEDFSHKEAKDGQITIGEYRITLPDGRTQVVRYTAGGKHGYKADVTYENQGRSQELPPAGPSPSYHRHKSSGQKQYHSSVQPTPFSPTSAPSFNSDRIYKSRPLKTTPLYGEDDDDEYQQHQHQRGTPKITFKGGNGPRAPTPTPEYAYNGVSTTPTPRPNSIYDKISPYRGGNIGKQGYKLDDLAYAHENSPRAGPVRSKTRNLPVPEAPQKGRSTAASYYDTQQVQPHHPKIKVSARPTKKYKDPAFYYAGPQQSHQSQVNHVNAYVGPKHFQYLQETPAQSYSPSPSPVTKQLKQSHRHVVPLEQYKSGGPIRVAYNYNSPKPKKQKKNKYGIHQPLGQYLVQTPATVETPTYQQPTSPALLPKEPFHYYNSFHSSHHHGFGQISPSPTPSDATNSLGNNNQHYPSPYPVTAYSTPTKPYQSEHVTPTQHRQRLPSPPSTSGHVYLETPASGARPNRLGIKEALSRLPNIPEAKTTVHPYEVGSVDYGKGVGYGNIPVDPDNIEPGVQRGYEGFFNGVTEANLDPTSFFSAGGGGEDQYFQNDQFNFLGGLNNFDIEQANVREIRQPKQRRRRQRRPGKRRGLPAPSAPPETEAAPTPSQQSSQQSETQPPKRRQQPTTSRGKGKRRRMRTQQPDPMMHAVESRRSRPRNSSQSSEN